jgi:photosystem II stability/assembly factor-like uncharacterized protein
MKRIIRLLPALLSLTISLSAQDTTFWKPFPGPSGGTFDRMAPTSSGKLYGFLKLSPFVTDLYRTHNNGQQWTKITPVFNGYLAGNIDIGYSGTFNAQVIDSSLSNAGLFRSFDEGLTWTLVKDSVTYADVSETPGGSLLARSANGEEIWRSGDGGITWAQVFSANEEIMPPLQVLQSGALAYTNAAKETYLSRDDGQSWQLIAQTAQQTPWSLYNTQSGTLLILSTANFYRSTDNGLNWQTIPTPDFRLHTLVELASGMLLAVTSYKDGRRPGLSYSNDDGQTWLPQPGNHEIWPSIMPFRMPDGALFGLCNQALYHSADNGQTWQFASYGIPMAPVEQMAFVSADTFYAHTPNGLWRTFNNGQAWTKITDFKSSQDFNLVYLRNFVSGDAGQLVAYIGDSLYWSDDYGDHFTQISPVNLYPGCVEMTPDGSAMFVNANGPSQFQLLRSGDHGQSWQAISGPSLIMNQMEVHPSGRLFAAMNVVGNDTLPGIWYSDDLGENWTPATGVPADILFKDLHIDPAGVIYAIGKQGADQYPMYRSKDNGQSWLRHPVDTYGTFSYGPMAGNAAGHLLYLKAPSVQRSVDQGVTWNALPYSYGTNILDPVSPDQYLFISIGRLYRTPTPTTQGAYIGGYIRRDADADCSTPDAQLPLTGWTVEAEGLNTVYGTSDSSGHYLMFVDTGTYAVQLQVPNAVWWTSCEAVQTILADSLFSLDTLGFSAAALSDCPLVTVDISVPGLRRCFDNNIYVNYRNEGTETADSAWVEVQIDPFTNLVSASLPYTVLGNDTYRFPVGDLPFGAGGQFSLLVNVECNSTVLGQTHCFNAHAYPDTLCTPVNNWSGAEIQATVSCQDTVVHLELQNAGDAPSQMLDYIIIIDDVVLMNGNRQYDPGETLAITQPATGHTWRIESEQEPGHPFSTLALAFKEGCGGYNSLGYINQFPVDPVMPSWDKTAWKTRAPSTPTTNRASRSASAPNTAFAPGRNWNTSSVFKIPAPIRLLPSSFATPYRPGSIRPRYGPAHPRTRTNGP